MGQEVPRLSSLRHILLQHEHPTTHHATCSPPLGSAGMHARPTKRMYARDVKEVGVERLQRIGI